MNKVHASAEKSRKSKGHNHAEVLKRFRLTRFGWERRRAGFHGKKKRLLSYKQKQQTKGITFLHRSDMKMIKRTAWMYKLKLRDFPQNPNPNLRPTRLICGSHFG